MLKVALNYLADWEAQLGSDSILSTSTPDFRSQIIAGVVVAGIYFTYHYFNGSGQRIEVVNVESPQVHSEYASNSQEFLAVAAQNDVTGQRLLFNITEALGQHDTPSNFDDLSIMYNISENALNTVTEHVDSIALDYFTFLLGINYFDCFEHMYDFIYNFGLEA